MTTVPLHKYIERTLSLDEPWIDPSGRLEAYNKHLLPTLDHADWKTAFTGGNQLQRENLAIAWAWAFAVKSKNNSFDRYGLNESWCVERNAKWIQQIEPYIPKNLGEYADPNFMGITGMLFCRIDRAANEVIRPLWFGSDEEKQASLLAMANNDDMAAKINGLKSSHNRIWEVAELPSSTIIHLRAAASVSAYLGRSRANTTPAFRDEMMNWYRLGDLATKDASNVNWLYPNDYENLNKTVNFIKSQPPELALPVFAETLEKASTTNNKVSMLTLPYTEVDGVAVDENNVYDLLKFWFPQFEQNWSTAQSIGIDFMDAVNMVMTETSANNQYENTTLPAELDL